MIRLAIKEANNSSFHFRLGAVICKGGRILASGHNKINCHTKDSEFEWSKHAEVDAIYKFINKHKDKCIVKNTTLYVVRLSKLGELKNSFPCNKCMSLIKKVGIKKIYYSNEKGEIGVHKI